VLDFFECYIQSASLFSRTLDVTVLLIKMWGLHRSENYGDHRKVNNFKNLTLIILVNF
jgi:hypothetical protein